MQMQINTKTNRIKIINVKIYKSTTNSLNDNMTCIDESTIQVISEARESHTQLTVFNID